MLSMGCHALAVRQRSQSCPRLHRNRKESAQTLQRPCGATTTTLIDQEEAWQEENAGKQVHASVSLSYSQLLSKD